MEGIKGLNKTIHLVNPTNNNNNNSHYTTVLYGQMSSRLSKAKFHSLRILLDSGARSYIVLVKHEIKMHNKNTQPVIWNTQGGDFHITNTTNM